MSFSAKDLKAEGFSAEDLKQASSSAEDLKAADQLKRSGHSGL